MKAQLITFDFLSKCRKPSSAIQTSKLYNVNQGGRLPGGVSFSGRMLSFLGVVLLKEWKTKEQMCEVPGKLKEMFKMLHLRKILIGHKLVWFGEREV